MPGRPLDDNLENSFADIFKEINLSDKKKSTFDVTVNNVFQQAVMENRHLFVKICSELMLDGSGIRGVTHLTELADLAEKGESCLICSKHCSNFDVPNLYTLMSRYGSYESSCFNRIIFIAGRKLNEDSPGTKMMAEMFNRLIISPKSYLDSLSPDDTEKHKQARRINIASQRKLRELKYKGYILLLYPTGTRTRSEEPETSRALRETVAYMRMFDNVCFINTFGNTLPPMLSRDLLTETPHCDVIKFVVSPVIKTGKWLNDAAAAFENCNDPHADRKQWIADRVMNEIDSLRDV